MSAIQTLDARKGRVHTQAQRTALLILPVALVVCSSFFCFLTLLPSSGLAGLILAKPLFVAFVVSPLVGCLAYVFFVPRVLPSVGLHATREVSGFSFLAPSETPGVNIRDVSMVLDVLLRSGVHSGFGGDLETLDSVVEALCRHGPSHIFAPGDRFLPALVVFVPSITLGRLVVQLWELMFGFGFGMFRASAAIIPVWFTSLRFRSRVGWQREARKIATEALKA